MPNSDDPTLSTGDVDDPILPCQCHDVELVSDLEEPNSMAFESAVEEDEPVAIAFSAMVKDSGGNSAPLHKDGSQEEEAESGSAEGADSARNKEDQEDQQDQQDKEDQGDSARDA